MKKAPNYPYLNRRRVVFRKFEGSLLGHSGEDFFFWEPQFTRQPAEISDLSPPENAWRQFAFFSFFFFFLTPRCDSAPFFLVKWGFQTRKSLSFDGFLPFFGMLDFREWQIFEVAKLREVFKLRSLRLMWEKIKLRYS